MDSATARGMTKFGFCCYSRNNKAVMLRVVAASKVSDNEAWIPRLRAE